MLFSESLVGELPYGAKCGQKKSRALARLPFGYRMEAGQVPRAIQSVPLYFPLVGLFLWRDDFHLFRGVVFAANHWRNGL